MTTQTATNKIRGGYKAALPKAAWVKISLLTSLASIAMVLITQVVALAIWPQAAAFKPLDSYPRVALFTLVPVLIATALFAWLNKTKDQPRQAFLKIAAVVLLLSFIPDYLLPDPNRTLLASTIAAFLHLVAGVVTVGVLFRLQEYCEKKHE